MWQAGFTYFCLLRFLYYYCTAWHCVWSMAAVALQSRAWIAARSLRPYQTPHISYGSCYLGLNTDIFYGHRHSQYFISRTRTFYITRIRIWTRTRTCRTLPCSCTDMDMGYGCLRHWRHLRNLYIETSASQKTIIVRRQGCHCRPQPEY